MLLQHLIETEYQIVCVGLRSFQRNLAITSITPYSRLPVVRTSDTRIDAVASDNPYAPPESDVAVSEAVELAGRELRLGGAIIDGVITMVVMWPVMYATGYWDRVMAEEQTFADNLLLGAFGFGAFLILNGYLLATAGQTIGKRLVKTRIVSVHDEKILPFMKVVSLRYLTIWVISQVPLLGQIFGLANVLFIFRADRRCIHDHFAGTKVISIRAA